MRADEKHGVYTLPSYAYLSTLLHDMGVLSTATWKIMYLSLMNYAERGTDYAP